MTAWLNKFQAMPFTPSLGSTKLNRASPWGNPNTIVAE